MTDPTWMSPEPHPFHHAATAPGVTCGWCPNWRQVHCAERVNGCRSFEESGATWPIVYRCTDGKVRCWDHRAIGNQIVLGL
jgi:hypothetical protein